MESLFHPYYLGNIRLRNRIIKSAVYEGRCDKDGFPTDSYFDFYKELAINGVGGIITGFAFISREGRAMHPRQAGIDDANKIPFYIKFTRMMHEEKCPVFLQIAHTGRQTLKTITGTDVRGCSAKRSIYFRGKPKPLSTAEVYDVVNDFAEAAYLSQQSGFNGIQLHAAHGYLIHQFILRAVNNRHDEFGIDPASGLGTEFLKQIIVAIRKGCGEDFPILIKISGGIDLKPSFTLVDFMELIRFLDQSKVNGIEISYGTMDHALNIFRGDVPEEQILNINPILRTSNKYRKIINRLIIRNYFARQLKPFQPHYNLDFARLAKQLTQIPIISVGGFRNGTEMLNALNDGDTDLVGLARPLIAEPDFIHRLQKNGAYISRCINCNKCAIMCDSSNETKCYNLLKK